MLGSSGSGAEPPFPDFCNTHVCVCWKQLINTAALATTYTCTLRTHVCVCEARSSLRSMADARFLLTLPHVRVRVCVCVCVRVCVCAGSNMSTSRLCRLHTLACCRSQDTVVRHHRAPLHSCCCNQEPCIGRRPEPLTVALDFCKTCAMRKCV